MKQARSQLRVRPVRFSSTPAAMARFLADAGLDVAVEGPRGQWFDCVAGSGKVAVHEAASSDPGAKPGETTLSFEVSDVEALCAHLVSVGDGEAVVWDEAYGRVLGARDPHGVQLWLDEVQSDTYGYVERSTRPDADVVVCSVVLTPLVDEYVAFLGRLGLSVTYSSTDYVSLDAPDGGSVGVHRAPARSVELAFCTRGSLDALARRLEEAGHAATLVPDVQIGDRVEVGDPDGRRLEIHTAS